VARFEARREGESAPDGVDPERGALQDADGGVGQRCDPLGVQVIGEHGGDELAEAVAVERMGVHKAAAWIPSIPDFRVYPDSSGSISGGVAQESSFCRWFPAVMVGSEVVQLSGQAAGWRRRIDGERRSLRAGPVKARERASSAALRPSG
jgi:hypothetical protein